MNDEQNMKPEVATDPLGRLDALVSGTDYQLLHPATAGEWHRFFVSRFE